MKQTEIVGVEDTRIPDDWEVKNINKECTIKARIGWQGLKSTEYLDSGDYILVTGTDFDSGFINWNSCSYVTKWRFDQDKNIQIKQGDILITKDGTIGKVAFLNEIPMQGTLNSGVFVIRPKNSDKIDSVFLSLIFKSIWFDSFLEQITSGSTIVHLYQKDFVKFDFPLPSKEEQTAMMQQLLTGKIRLVK
jgi:type I restriction enzyme S subunit